MNICSCGLTAPVLNKQQVLRDLREQGLTFHSIDLKDPLVRVVGSARNPDCRKQGGDLAQR